jgi:hypothetical protein
MRIVDMIKRRTLLAAFPLALVSACARAQPTNNQALSSADMAGMAGQTLADLTGGPGKVAWLSLNGTVRLTVGNDDVRPATLKRAITMSTGADGKASAKIFDIWQIAALPGVAAPSATLSTQTLDDAEGAIWLMRSFTHRALNKPIESSRLSRTNARVIAIDATQIWLLDGAVTPEPQALSGEALNAFEAWRAA